MQKRFSIIDTGFYSIRYEQKLITNFFITRFFINDLEIILLNAIKIYGFSLILGDPDIPTIKRFFVPSKFLLQKL